MDDLTKKIWMNWVCHDSCQVIIGWCKPDKTIEEYKTTSCKLKRSVLTAAYSSSGQPLPTCCTYVYLPIYDVINTTWKKKKKILYRFGGS